MSGGSGATAGGGAATAAAPAAAPQPLNILDAVCVLHFVPSGQLDLLLKILAAGNYQIYLPAEVIAEVRYRASRNGWSIADLERVLTAGGPIVEVPEITAADQGTFRQLTRVRGRHPNVLSGSTDPTSKEDLGECVVITHAMQAQRLGLDVVVSIDDLKGQSLASRHQVSVFTIEDAFSVAMAHDLLTTLEAKAAYENLQRYGSGLPSWDAILGPRLKRERGQRKQAAKKAAKAAAAAAK